MIAKRKLRLGARIFTTVLAITMLCSISVFAEEYNSVTSQVTVEGITYNYWATLYTYPEKQATTWINTEDYVRVPEGKMSVQARMFTSSGSLLDSSVFKGNEANTYFVYADTRAISTPQTVYSKGKIRINYGSSPVTHETEATANVTRATLPAPLAATLDRNGNYPVNSSGETYGSALLDDFVGYEPDLILATGKDGVQGYVREEELFPTFNNAQEYLSCVERFQNNRTIPLYNREGTVIGTFELTNPGQEPTEEITQTIQVLQKASLAAKGFDPAIVGSLVNGDYPRNSNGETYGAALLSEIVGYGPDLVRAVGVDGVEGYVRESDLFPSYANAEELFALSEKMNQNPSVPLYDSEGNIIGSFALSPQGTPPSPKIQQTISEFNAAGVRFDGH